MQNMWGGQRKPRAGNGNREDSIATESSMATGKPRGKSKLGGKSEKSATTAQGTVAGKVLRQFDSGATRGSVMMKTSVLGRRKTGSSVNRRHRASIHVTYLPIRLAIRGYGQVWSEQVHLQIEAACCVSHRAPSTLGTKSKERLRLSGVGPSERLTDALIETNTSSHWTTSQSQQDRRGNVRKGTTLLTSASGSKEAPKRVSSRWPFLMLARLKRLRLLGSGGFGDVYEAVDVMGGKHYALKQVRKRLWFK